MPDPQHMRDFWDARARENAEFFVDDQLDYNAIDQDRFWREGAAALTRMLDQAGAQVRPGDDVLDIGVGIGRLARALADQGAKVTGIDVSPEMIERAREALAGHDVALLVGDGTSLAGVADASMDAVVSLVVFQHIPDPQITLGYIREIGRVLRPGGWAAFQVSNNPEIHTKDYKQPSALKKLLGRAPKGQDDPAWRGSAVSLEDLDAAIAAGGMQLAQRSGEATQFCIVRTVKSAAV